jgi:hypothetical protein
MLTRRCLRQRGAARAAAPLPLLLPLLLLLCAALRATAQLPPPPPPPPEYFEGDVSGADAPSLSPLLPLAAAAPSLSQPPPPPPPPPSPPPLPASPPPPPPPPGAPDAPAAPPSPPPKGTMTPRIHIYDLPERFLQTCSHWGCGQLTQALRASRVRGSAGRAAGLRRLPTHTHVRGCAHTARGKCAHAADVAAHAARSTTSPTTPRRTCFGYRTRRASPAALCCALSRCCCAS